MVLLLASLCVAVVACAAPAAAVAPAGAMAPDLIIGTVTAVHVYRSGDGPILTQVDVSDPSGVRRFTMEGGMIGGVGLWTEQYRNVAVGQSVAASVVSTEAPVAQAASAPVVLSSGTGRSVSDYLYNNMRWDYASLPITWMFNTANAPAGALAAVRAGPDTWEADRGSAIDFTYGGVTTAIPDTADSINTVGWEENISGSELAHCMYWYYGAAWGYEIVEFDINFNRYYSWSTAPSSSQYDIQTVATHEFGHTLNLEDMYSASASGQMMYGYTGAGQVKRTLGDGDIQGVRIIYPSSEPPIPVDVTPPSVQCDAISSYAGPADISVVASDSESGVVRIETRLDAEATSTTHGDHVTVHVDTAGSHSLLWAAFDGAGNVSRGGSTFVVGDASPPLTVADYPAGWVSTQTVSLRLSAVDVGGSLVADTYCQVGAEAVQTYTAPITVSTEGTTSVSFWSVDSLGNRETPQYAHIRIDRSPPVAVDTARSKYTNVARFSVCASDTYSGVSEITYRCDGESPQTLTGPARTLVLRGIGEHVLTYSFTDLAGNASPEKRLEFNVEKAPLQKAKLVVTPSKSTTTVRRASGVAQVTFAVQVRDANSEPLADYAVRLQRRSATGRWTTVHSVKTGSAGSVSKRVVFRSKGTSYWRWYLPKTIDTAATTSAVRVVVTK
jgi:hypothetical protein